MAKAAKTTKAAKLILDEDVESVAPSKIRRINIQDDYYADVVAVHMNLATTSLLFGRSLPREIDGKQVEVMEVQRSVSMNPIVAEALYQALDRSFAIRLEKEAEAKSAEGAVRAARRTRSRTGK